MSTVVLWAVSGGDAATGFLVKFGIPGGLFGTCLLLIGRLIVRLDRPAPSDEDTRPPAVTQ